MRNEKLKMLVEMALAVALAWIFDKIVVFKMPQGGSISLEMLPMLFISFRWGIKAGLLTGMAHGLLQLFGGYIVHPIQLVMDYPLPYMMLGLAGLFKTKFGSSKSIVNIITGSVVGGFGRFLSHLIAGVVFWGKYAPEGQNPWVYSAIYNGSYIIPALLICIVVLIAINKPLSQLDRADVAA